MAAGTQKWSVRFSPAESPRLAWALAISLLLHLLVFGTYKVGQHYALWQTVQWPDWVRALTQTKKNPVLAVNQLKPSDPPLLFIDVSPAQATVEPPKNALFYSDKNAHAANPSAEQDTGVPKITGNQTQVARTEDVPHEKTFPLQPVPPPEPEPPGPPVEEVKPKPAEPPGDMVIAKPEPPAPHVDEGQQPAPKPTRPRTLAQARAMQDNRLPGEKIKSAGGVSRHLDFASFDVKATPFGAYDWALVQAVQERWFSLLNQREYASDGRGRVVVRFSLRYDGTISGVGIAESTTSEVLAYVCVRAIEDPAPFPAWPSDMRHEISSGTRDVQFTFYYN
jgi:outer membrane biosynthesis protein TonB